MILAAGGRQSGNKQRAIIKYVGQVVLGWLDLLWYAYYDPGLNSTAPILFIKFSSIWRTNLFRSLGITV